LFRHFENGFMRLWPFGKGVGAQGGKKLYKETKIAICSSNTVLSLQNYAEVLFRVILSFFSPDPDAK